MAKKQSGFAAEFAKQRAALGAGKTFTYNGKSYSTNRADDKPAAKGASKAPKASAAPAVSARSKANPYTSAGTAQRFSPSGAASSAAASPRPKANPYTSAGTAQRFAPAGSSPRPKPRPASVTITTPAASPRPAGRNDKQEFLDEKARLQKEEYDAMMKRRAPPKVSSVAPQMQNPPGATTIKRK
jgi:hypothetical protein